MRPCQASHAGVHGPKGEKEEEAHGKITHLLVRVASPMSPARSTSVSSMAVKT